MAIHALPALAAPVVLVLDLMRFGSTARHKLLWLTICFVAIALTRACRRGVPPVARRDLLSPKRDRLRNRSLSL